MAILSAREARARRAVEKWLEVNDARGTPLDVLATKVTDNARQLARDLAIDELDTVCSSVVAAHVHAEEQRKAEEAIASAREEERVRYLRKVQADIIARRDDDPRGGKP